MVASRGLRACAGALVALATSCAPPPSAPSAIVVTIDTWRADRFGAGGHPRVRTPHLDRFFRRAVQFSDAWAPAPTTLASHATLLTGRWPSGHRIPRNGWPLPDDVPTLAEELHRAGVATGAFISSAALDPAFGLGRGFDVYDAHATQTVARDQAWRRADETLALAWDWWSGAKGRRLLFVHLFEPHFPYEPRREDFALYDTGYRGPANGSMDFLFALWDDASLFTPDVRAHLEALYHAEITGVDRAMGRFLEAAAEVPDALIVVTSDHGESLGEHGLRFKHGPYVYESDVHVALGVRGAGPPRVSSATVRTIDISRTIAEWFQLRAEVASEGDDLRAHVGGGRGREAYSEASMPWDAEAPDEYPNARKQRAVRSAEWSYIETPWRGEVQWVRRAEDPGEVRPLSVPPSDAPATLAERLRAWIGRGVARAAPSGVDASVRERLRSLGYVDGNP